MGPFRLPNPFALGTCSIPFNMKREKLNFVKICIFPEENHYFSGFCKKHVFAIFMHFSFQNSSQNPSKTRSEHFKNRCRKRVDFQHRFFEVLASIWEGLVLSRWSQVGSKWPPGLRAQPPKSLLKLNVFKKYRLGCSRARFWSLWPRILEGLGTIS